jgi:hypothetical protein
VEENQNLDKTKEYEEVETELKATGVAYFWGKDAEKVMELDRQGKLKWRPLTEEEWKDIAQGLRELRKGTLPAFFEVLEQHFEVKDRIGFTIVLAAAAAHQVPGEMLWMRIYGASRSGKTELLEAIAKHGDSTEMEAITPASIRGGLKGGHKLLNRVNGKLVITKDLATILTAKREARNEVFGLLRNVKDGKLTADFGTQEGYVAQVVKFDWLIGTTPVFAQYKQMEDLLGARYVDLNWKTGDREEMAFRAALNSGIMGEIRSAIAAAVCDLLDKAKAKQLAVEPLSAVLPLREDWVRLISDWADLTALLRSPVARDRQHRVKFHPEPEVGTDLAQAFTRIVQGLMLLDIYDWEPYIARLAQDSIPYSRRLVIAELSRGGIGEVSVRIPDSTRSYELDDLEALGVIHKKDKKWWVMPGLRARVGILASYWG